MKIIAFFASILIVTSAFNLTEYHRGVILPFGFNTTQIDTSFTCLDALESNYEEFYHLIMSKDFDNITANLGELILQLQSTLVSSCAAYMQDEMNYVAANTNISNLKQTIEDNFKDNCLVIIQNIADWYNHLAKGQDFSAGFIQTQTMRILIGAQKYFTSSSEQLSASEIVPFNASQFFSEYYGRIFLVLGIKEAPNVTALVQCYGYIQNVTIDLLYMKENIGTYDFEQKLNAVQYLFGLGFETVRNCEGAAETEELILGPIARAFSEDPVHFTFEVINKVLLHLTGNVGSLQGEITAIQAGQYCKAGNNQAALLYNIFHGLVNFTSTN